MKFNRSFMVYEGGAIFICALIFLFLFLFDDSFEMNRALRLTISLFAIYQFVLLVSWLLGRYRRSP